MTRRPFALLAGCGAALFVLMAMGLYEQGQDDLRGFAVLALTQSGVYFGAVWLVRRTGSGRATLMLVLAVAAAMRLAALAAPPFLSTDVYRYVWDGRVAAAGINPYRYIPTDPHLASLRDRAVFPEINRSNYAPTIYPPAAQAVFVTVASLGGAVTAMKAAMVGFDAIAIFALLRLLAGAGLPSALILIYAWHPLPVWEFAGSGHIDAALVAFVALALWGSRRGAAGLAGLALAAATLVKFYPAVLAPALYRRWDRTMPALFAAAVALAYLPFLGVGWRVFGFLPGYAAEEGFAGGAGFYLLSLARLAIPALSAQLYIAAAMLVLAALGLFVLFGRRSQNSDIADAAALATAVTVLLSPHYPWYFAWLIPFACLLPCRSLLWLTGASMLLYLVPVGSQLVRDAHRTVVETALYAPFAVLALIDWRSRRQVGHGKPARG